MQEIMELTVQALDGEFYYDTKAYLIKRGCVWSEKRGELGQLLEVSLHFPPGTTYQKLNSSDGRLKLHQIILKGNGLMYWSIRADDQLNRIAVPYMWL